jgi:hypothetical protein
VSRDNLDENGQRRAECEAAAGSGIIIFSRLSVRKHFFARRDQCSDVRLAMVAGRSQYGSLRETSP